MCLWGYAMGGKSWTFVDQVFLWIMTLISPNFGTFRTVESFRGVESGCYHQFQPDFFGIISKHTKYCWWFRHPKQPPGMFLKPCKYWDINHIHWWFLPSTVSWLFQKNMIRYQHTHWDSWYMMHCFGAREESSQNGSPNVWHHIKRYWGCK